MAGGVLAAAACRGGRTEPKPVAALASSPAAAAVFQAIRDAWSDQDRTTPAALRAMLEQFLARFPGEGLAPLAQSALALVAMNQGDLKTADAQIALAAGLLIPFLLKEIRRGKVQLGPRTPVGAGDNHPGKRGDPAPGQPDAQADPYDTIASR